MMKQIGPKSPAMQCRCSDGEVRLPAGSMQSNPSNPKVSIFAVDGTPSAPRLKPLRTPAKRPWHPDRNQSKRPAKAVPQPREGQWCAGWRCDGGSGSYRRAGRPAGCRRICLAPLSRREIATTPPLGRRAGRGDPMPSAQKRPAATDWSLRAEYGAGISVCC